SATAMPGLYAGKADLALLGRENNITDDNGFGRVKLYAPRRFELMTGSLATEGKAPALVVLVHRDNPLARLTLAQLDALFSCEHRRSPATLRTWGQLGLTGEWADRPIHLYGYDAETGTGQYFARTVLGGSRKLNWENFREFKNSRNLDGTALPASQQILEALRADPWGLAVGSLRYADERVKALPLAADDGSPFVSATADTLISRAYPLTRLTYAFVDQPPGRPLDPKVKEFLRYIFSRQGQDDILRDRGYLPLKPEILAAQLHQLEGTP
ncbi:MAG: PstS family phosphate ABC transporter substrate-binding protein, partial [Opitutales bacterium]